MIRWVGVARITGALLLIAIVGSLPAWLIDRYVPLPATLYTGISIVSILALVTWLDFTAIARRWMDTQQDRTDNG